MSRYNDFCQEVVCPECGKPSVVCFQAYIGVLDFRRFNPGDEVFELESNYKKPQIGPDGVPARKDLWAYGIGNCGQCNALLWARVEVRNGKFDKLVVVPAPEDQYQWGYL